MMKRRLYVLSLCLIPILLAQCARSTRAVVGQDVPERGATAAATSSEAERTAGKLIFEDKCANCHRLKLPENYTAEQWERILPGMIKRSRLDGDAAAKVRAYVFSGAKANQN